jgi:hypothetical protein
VADEGEVFESAGHGEVMRAKQIEAQRLRHSAAYLSIGGGIRGGAFIAEKASPWCRSCET